MAYLINRIEKSLRNEGLAPRTDKARAWLQSKVKSLNPSRTRLMEDKSRLRDTCILPRISVVFLLSIHINSVIMLYPITI